MVPKWSSPVDSNRRGNAATLDVVLNCPCGYSQEASDLCLSQKSTHGFPYITR